MFPVNIIHYIFLFLSGLVTGGIIGRVVRRYCSGKPQGSSSSACNKRFFLAGTLFSLFTGVFPGVKGAGVKGDRGIKAVFGRKILPGLVSAVLFLLSFYYLGFSAHFFKYVVIFNLLLLVSFIDLEVGLIPNRFVLIILIWVLLWQLFYPGLSPLSALLGFIVGAGLFFIIVLLSRGGMGGGDVKLMAVLGLAAGWPDVLIVMVLAFVLGAVTGAGLLISRKKTRRDALAFAPFLMLAFILVSFWGREIWQWYLVSM